MKRLARFLLFLLLVLVLFAGFVFTLNNTAPVPLWLGTDINPKPLGVWMLLAFSAGGLLGLLLGLGLWQRLRNRFQVRHLRTQVQQLEKELGELKLQAATARERDNSGGA